MPTTSVVVRPGQIATLDALGNVILQLGPREPASSGEVADGSGDWMTVDPITYEVVRHRLWSLNEEHGITIARISGSPIVAFAHDFNPCLHAADGELIFSGPYIQALNAGAPNAIRWIISEYGADFIRADDMFLTNDPWVGVSHQIDVSILAPLYVDGKLIGWVSNAVHQYDVGGPVPGSFIPYAREIFEESAPIPPIRIVEEGLLRPDPRAHVSPTIATARPARARSAGRDCGLQRRQGVVS